MRKKLLSIVVISKNEEKVIGKCIEELLKIRFIKKEIILVDSNSSDKTREIAKKYPIRIINLVESNVYSAPAGRNIGLKESKGDFILFIDGDQIINVDWLKNCLDIINTEEIDSIYGKYLHIQNEENFYGFNQENFKKSIKISKSSVLVGTFLIKNSKILKDEQFNPFLKAEEERDLAYRLIDHGFKMAKTDSYMAAHFMKKEDLNEISEKIGFYKGIGQIFKKYFFSDWILSLIIDFKNYLILSLLWILIVLALIFTNIKLFLVSFLFLNILIFIKNKFKINKHYLVILLKSLMILPKFIQGLFSKTEEKDQFKYKIKLIKK